MIAKKAAPKGESMEDGQNLKRMRSFISYYEKPQHAQSEKAEEVTHLAAHFASLDAEGKKSMARD